MIKLFAVLTGLSALGPIALIPLSLNRLSISSCVFLPPSPISEKPPAIMVIPFTRLAIQSLTIFNVILAGTEITARSTSPSMLFISGYAFSPLISAALGFTGYTFPGNFRFTRFDTRKKLGEVIPRLAPTTATLFG